jgi:hypothetical protein
MVVRCEARCDPWLQIQFNEFDAVWVLEKSGDITLMDRLHDFVQQRLPNFMNRNSPVAVPSSILELTRDELREELLKKREMKRELEEKAEAEERARREEEMRKKEEKAERKREKRRETMNRGKRRDTGSGGGKEAQTQGEGEMVGQEGAVVEVGEP